MQNNKAPSELMGLRCPLCRGGCVLVQSRTEEGAEAELSSKFVVGTEQTPIVPASCKQSLCSLPPTSSEHLPCVHNSTPSPEYTEMKKNDSPHGEFAVPLFGVGGVKKSRKKPSAKIMSLLRTFP